MSHHDPKLLFWIKQEGDKEQLFPFLGAADKPPVTYLPSSSVRAKPALQLKPDIISLTGADLKGHSSMGLALHLVNDIKMELHIWLFWVLKCCYFLKISLMFSGQVGLPWFDISVGQESTLGYLNTSRSMKNFVHTHNICFSEKMICNVIISWRATKV